MPFPAPDPLAMALNNIQSEARSLKLDATGVRALSAAGTISADVIVRFHLRLIASRDKFTATGALPGLAQFAKDQFNNQALDIAAEFTAMVAACTAVAQWVVDNFPNAAGFIQKDTFTTTTPGITTRTFTTAALAGYRTQLDSLIATIG